MNHNVLFAFTFIGALLYIGTSFVIREPIVSKTDDQPIQTNRLDVELQLPQIKRGLEENKQKDLAFRLANDSRWGVCARFDCWFDDDPDQLPRCRDQNAPTDFSGQDGYPPCCVHLLRDALDDFTAFLTLHDFTHFVHYGTLLGAYRGKEIIPWTPDVDLALDPDDFDEMNNSTDDLKSQLWDLGYNIFKEGKKEPMTMGRLCINQNWRGGILSKFPKALPSGQPFWNHQPYLDLYMIRNTANNTITTTQGPCHFPEDWIFPLGKVQIGNKEYPAPNKIENMLHRIYGPTWATPAVTKNKWHCGKPAAAPPDAKPPPQPVKTNNKILNKVMQEWNNPPQPRPQPQPQLKKI